MALRGGTAAWLFGAVLAIVGVPTLVSAQIQQDTILSATVPSSVSASLSTLKSDLSQLPADGKSSVLFTATIVDSAGTPMANKDFVLTSNRGEVDTIKCYDGNTLLTVNQTVTDAQGIARCIAYSSAPGEATFSGTADAVVLNDKPTVIFTPLPAISNISVTVTLPGKEGGKKITIIEPTKPSRSATTPSSDKLVNTQVELQIPFWVFILIIILLIASPLLFTILVIIYRKLRFYVIADKRQNEKEESLLSRIYELEQRLAQGQNIDLQQNQQISQQIAQSEKDLKQTVVEGSAKDITPAP